MKWRAGLHLMTKVWVTRSQSSSEDSGTAWRAAGFEPLLEPLLEIEPVSIDPLSKKDVLIFTSKNAIDHVPCAGQRAICVGDATADKARRAGFKDVISVDGTASDITAWVTENLPKTESLCHVSGWHIRGSIIEDLRALGYAARRVKAYRSTPKDIWPCADFSFAALYSPLAAKTLARNAKDRDVSNLSAVCISEATAGEVQDLPLRSIIIAKRPREDELIMAAKILRDPALEV